ncbi:peptidoglycan/xylan/chitin deacetylase (PgdA/CDA1 family) [Kitasatospora sp. GAS204A]|uniref:polysaccharide deacetylase family protein n=1 Tax=unclassified Kitasatospora TaxID=2633591 RepID=UPI002473F36C|nr:polysaccharide deacetylase family protein [Kitasatospora sp. GAS204B]MDH6122176.1 peptidoglycan/xylan/chitin deacetylase (PgdA/CDA1 family) [Kitasatospora sp. GAS204B]
MPRPDTRTPDFRTPDFTTQDFTTQEYRTQEYRTPSEVPAPAAADRLVHWLRHSPAQPLFRAHAARRLVVLAYRRVTDRRAFGAQLDRLCRVAVPISLPALEQAVREGRPLPPRSVLITFDDADRGVLDHALPALAARGLPAVAFVVTELIGTDRPSWRQEAAFLLANGGHARSVTGDGLAGRLARLAALPDPDRRRSLHELRVSSPARPPRRERLTPEQLRRLTAGQVVIGNQTLGDADLRRCDDATVQVEIRTAHQALTDWLGGAPSAFAYPSGNHDPRAARLLTELGYPTAFVSDHRLSPRLPREALRVSRLPVDASCDKAEFEAVLSGLHPAVRRWRGV